MRRALIAGGTGALALGALIAGAGREDRPAAPVAKAATTFPVVGLEPPDVHQVVVTAPGARTALVRQRSGTWLAAEASSPDAPALLTESEGRLLPLVAFRRLAVDATRPEFGLTDPALQVTVQDHVGGLVGFRVGAPNLTGGGFYVGRDGDRHVYLITRRAVEDLRSLLFGYHPGGAEDPYPEGLTDALARVEEPEEVSNPWLAQAEEEAAR